MTTTLRDVNGELVTIRRGTSPVLIFNVKNLDGTPKNLTGASEIAFSIGESRTPASRDIQLTLASGISHTDVLGVVSVLFTQVQTEALPRGQRWCELAITDLAGNRDVVGEGPCEILDTLITIGAL